LELASLITSHIFVRTLFKFSPIIDVCSKIDGGWGFAPGYVDLDLSALGALARFREKPTPCPEGNA